MQTGKTASFLEAKFLSQMPENKLVFHFTDTYLFQAVWNSSVGCEFANRREKLIDKAEGCVCQLSHVCNLCLSCTPRGLNHLVILCILLNALPLPEPRTLPSLSNQVSEGEEEHEGLGAVKGYKPGVASSPLGLQTAYISQQDTGQDSCIGCF